MGATQEALKVPSEDEHSAWMYDYLRDAPEVEPRPRGPRLIVVEPEHATASPRRGDL